MRISLKAAARSLGGEVVSGQILCPGPNHSPEDRSLSLRFVATAPDGFVVHSFAGDDPIVCRDHVKQKLGIQRGDHTHIVPVPRRAAEPSDHWKIKQARQIWNDSRSIIDTIAEKYLQHRRPPFVGLDHA
jgi:hypothetical protein